MESLDLTCRITIYQLYDEGQSNTVSNNSFIYKPKGCSFYLAILGILLLVSTEIKAYWETVNSIYTLDNRVV